MWPAEGVAGANAGKSKRPRPVRAYPRAMAQKRDVADPSRADEEIRRAVVEPAFLTLEEVATYLNVSPRKKTLPM